jgi:hypothetical protein
MLKVDSIEAQVADDAVKSGLSLNSAWRMVSEHRRQETLTSVTNSALHGLVMRLYPKVQKVQQSKQGTCDVECNWAKARLGWSTQLLIRFGELD